jgi:two-component system LytT family response regulator
MKVVIIDDERLAREELRGLLATWPEITVSGEASNVTQALKVIADTKPDLLFLDIEMPRRTGFDLLEVLAPPHPKIIFITAYSEFAVRAFEVNALDYLMKPIHPQRLATALAKIRLRPEMEKNEVSPEDPRDNVSDVMLREDDRVYVRSDERGWFVPLRALRLLEASGNYTRLYFEDERPLLYRTLNSAEARLPSSLFLRANRSQLINLTFIENITPWFSGSLKVMLRGGPEVEFSRRQAQLFRKRTGL